MADSFIFWKRLTPGWLYFCKIPGVEPKQVNRMYVDWQPHYLKGKNSLNWSPQELSKGLQDQLFLLQENRTF